MTYLVDSRNPRAGLRGGVVRGAVSGGLFRGTSGLGAAAPPFDFGKAVTDFVNFVPSVVKSGVDVAGQFGFGPGAPKKEAPAAPAAESEDNTKLYIGLGVAAIAAFILLKPEKKAASAVAA